MVQEEKKNVGSFSMIDEEDLPRSLSRREKNAVKSAERKDDGAFLMCAAPSHVSKTQV